MSAKKPSTPKNISGPNTPPTVDQAQKTNYHADKKHQVTQNILNLSAQIVDAEENLKNLREARTANVHALEVLKSLDGKVS